MRKFLERNALTILVIVLAALLIAVCGGISLAYYKLCWWQFLIAWFLIWAVGGALLIKIIDVYEEIEINRFRRENNKNKNENHKKNTTV